jgi:hypothetical protein
MSDNVINEDFSNDSNEDFTITAMVMSSSSGTETDCVTKKSRSPIVESPNDETEMREERPGRAAGNA